jgi:hypothetical protein
VSPASEGCEEPDDPDRRMARRGAGPARQAYRFLGLRGLRVRSFSTRRLAIARGGQIFL